MLFNMSIIINFVFVAKRWKLYASKWTSLDEDLRALFIVDIKSRQTNSKILRWFVISTVGSFCNLILIYWRGFYLLCTDRYRGYFFIVVPYHISFGIIYIIVDCCVTMARQHNDLFIIFVCFLIGKHFDHLNSKISLNLSVRC